MRKIYLTIFLIMLVANVKADQLAYLSKQDAEIAVERIQKLKSITLFCGCCSMMEPEEVVPVKVYMEFTGFENYYEVFIEYWNNGILRSMPLDLAYTWKKGFFGYKTIGQLLGLKHDYCVKPKQWNNPVNIEKDI
jgi:hypothetical protein